MACTASRKLSQRGSEIWRESEGWMDECNVREIEARPTKINALNWGKDFDEATQDGDSERTSQLILDECFRFKKLWQKRYYGKLLVARSQQSNDNLSLRIPPTASTDDRQHCPQQRTRTRYFAPIGCIRRCCCWLRKWSAAAEIFRQRSTASPSAKSILTARPARGTQLQSVSA